MFSSSKDLVVLVFRSNPRSIRLKGISSAVPAPGLEPRSRSIRICAALTPMSPWNWATVVSGGVTSRAAEMSSKPATAMSRGMAMPRSRSACITPIAIRSLAAKIAVGA